MNNITKYLLALLCIVSIQCTDDFESMNKKPDGIVEIDDPHYLLLPMLTRGYSDGFQVSTNLYHDLYSQHWGNLNPGFDSDYYSHHNGWINKRWTNYYTNWIIPNYLHIKKMAEEEPRFNNVYQIARIWKLFMTSQMVDTWGDIPYTEAGNGGYAIKYDNAKEIYISLVTDLNDAANSFSDDKQLDINPTYDVVYEGDINKWKKFAQTIRARLAMRMVNVDKAFAKTNVVDAFSKGCIESNSENCLHPCDGTKLKNDYLNFAKWNENAMSKTMENILKNTSSVHDPRMALWFLPVSDGTYNGIRNGDPNSAKDPSTWSIGNKNVFSYENPYIIALASDSKFIKAEAALRGWISGEPKDIMEEGITLNMEYFEAESADITTYINGLPDMTGSNEDKLKQIMTQRWLGNFMNGAEGWANVRRTDYPALMPVLSSRSNTIPTGKFIKRILYVENEYKLNELIPVSSEDDSQNKRIFWDTSDDTPDNF